MTNHVYEKASETAKKIRKTLKQAFPGIKFSVTSSTFSMGSSVDVHWINGPFTPDVDSILNRFKPGYVWEGRTYMGANFVDSSRTLEGERKKVIESWMQANGALNQYGQYGVSEWGAAERELIQAGELQGYPSQLPAVEVPLDSDLENPMTPLAQVIPFPLRSPQDIARRKAEQIMSELSSEQKLKLECLRSLIGQEEIVMQLVQHPAAIDEMFQKAAVTIFG